MVTFDKEIIQTFADALYTKAETIVFVYTALGAVLGLFSMAFIGSKGIILALIFAGMGWWLGSSKAFALKLQAQMALCQVEIAENTKRTAAIATVE